MVAKLLNGRHSVKARELLSWNIHDLAHQTSLPPNVLTDFERGKHQLQRYQNIKVREAFESQGIVFSETLEMELKKKKSQAAERMRHISKQNTTKTESQQVLEKLLAKANNPPKL